MWLATGTTRRFSRRRQVAGIAVGGDHDLAALDRALGGQHPPARRGLLDALGLDIGAQDRAARGARPSAGRCSRARDGAGRRAGNHAAVVIVGGDHPRAGVRAAPSSCRHWRICCRSRPWSPDRRSAWASRRRRSGRSCAVALDALARDDGLAHGERIGAGAHQLGSSCARIPRRSGSCRPGPCRDWCRRDISRRCASRRRRRNRRAPARRRRRRCAQLQRRRQAAIARAHDHDIGLGRRVLGERVVGCPRFPPPRLRLEVGVEDVAAHPRNPSPCR